MASSELDNVNIQIRRGNRDTWRSQNPVLSDGQPGFERDTGRLKIGDNFQNYKELTYISHNDELLVLRSNKDNNGIFTKISYIIESGRVYCTSELSGGTSPNYNQLKVTYYNREGIQIYAIYYTLAYDSNGNLESKLFLREEV